MRIVAGRFKGQRLHTSSGNKMRPTLERVRESIFNVILHGLKNWEGSLNHASVIDVFAGTGSFGLETLSRGAAHATFIDNSPASLAITKRNAEHLGIWRNITLLKLDATQLSPPPLAAKAPCSLAFLDAPYNMKLTQPALANLERQGWLANNALVVVEIAAKENLSFSSNFSALEERTYGPTKVVFLNYDT